MKKIPRDISGQEFIRLLKKYEYSATRQAGSHIRLTTRLKGQHHITVPDHNPIKLGTLSSLLSAIAKHLEISKQSLIDELF